MAMSESRFEARLIREIEEQYPGAVTLKMYPNYLQGFPDRLILFENTWASLETKRSEIASKRKNQDYWVNLLNNMSFARFVFPENKDEVLDELQQTFGANRSSRLFKP